MPFIFFLPNCSGYNFSTKLNKSVESRHPGLVPDIREKTFSLLSLSMMLTVRFFFSFSLINTVLFQQNFKILMN